MSIIKSRIVLILLVMLFAGSSALAAVGAVTYQVTVATDKATYQRGASVGISGKVTGDGSPVSGRTVGIEIHDPANKILSLLMADTGGDGTYSAFFQLSASADYGSYQIFVAVAQTDVHGTTLFVVSASPPPDTTPPVISNVATSSITDKSAVVGWTTNEAATSQVEYGTSASYGSTTALVQTLDTNHAIVLSGLTPTTTYHFRVKSSDAAGNPAQSADYTFTTVATTSTTSSTTTSSTRTTTPTTGTSTTMSTSTTATSSTSATVTSSTSAVSTSSKSTMSTFSSSMTTVSATLTTTSIPVPQPSGATYLQVSSNSTISALKFDSSRRLLNFTVSGPTNTVGFTLVVFAKSLIDGFPVVLMDNGKTSLLSLVPTSNSTHYSLMLTYPHSTHQISIGGSNTIPEFQNNMVQVAIVVLALALLSQRLIVRVTAPSTSGSTTSPFMIVRRKSHKGRRQ